MQPFVNQSLASGAGLRTQGDKADAPELAFPHEEYELRLARARRLLEDRQLGACLINTPENIYYLTGHHSQGFFEYQTLILSPEREPVLITRFLERPNVRALSWLQDVVGYGDTDDPVDVTRKVLQDLGLERGTIGLEKACWFLTRPIQERLEDALPEVHWQDGGGLIEGLRVVKSEREIAYIRQAARVAEVGMATGLAAVQAGRTENDVAAEVYRGLIMAGSEYTGFVPFVTSGPRVAMSHATWSGRLLQKGDVVFIELAGCVKRYHACLMRCAVLGAPSTRVRAMANACLEALEATIAAMRPGAMTGQVDRACRSVFDAAGWGEHFNHKAGYSIGIGFPPSWSEGHVISLKPNGTQLLEPGMVFHLVPTIFIPGEGGVAVDETVLITPQGNEVLTHFERDLKVVG